MPSMSSLILATITLVLSISSPLAVQADVETYPSILPFPTVGDDLLTIYKGLHSNPELSFKEVQSANFMASELKNLGFKVTTNIGDAWIKAKAKADVGEVLGETGGYGVVGVFRNGNGPTVLIRADMDALPIPERTGLPYASVKTQQTWTGVDSPVMHGCGHDIHMTSWVGTARALIKAKNKWSGTLIMIAQPAEEIGLGARAMIAEGLYDKFPLPDYNLALHVSSALPSGKVAYSQGWALANVDSVDITVKGVGGHGAYPHTTVDPVLIASHIVTSLQSIVARNVDPQKPAVITVGSFKAGAKHNIISNQAQLLLTVRSYDEETRQLLLDSIKRVAYGQAEAFGAPEPIVKFESDFTPSTYNNPQLAQRVMGAIGRKIGKRNVEETPPVMGGEDFGRYNRTSEAVPGLIFWLGAIKPSTFKKAQNSKLPLPSLHSPIFAPDPGRTIDTGVKAMTAAALELFEE